MKKIITVFLVLVLTLFPSCAKRAPRDLLQYQASSWRINVDCVQGDAHYSAILKIDTANGTYAIEYTSPSELCGIKLYKNDKGCEISLFGATVPIEEYAVSEMLKIFRLFEVDPDTLSQFSERADDSYLAIFEDKNEKYEIILDKLTNTPRKIDATLGGEKISIKINSMELLN